MKLQSLLYVTPVLLIQTAGHGQATRKTVKPLPAKPALPASKAALNRALVIAVGQRNLAKIDALLAQGADLRFNHGEALDSAIQMGDVRVVEHLIAKGADVNLPNWEGGTPLQRSLSSKNYGATTLLLRAGATVTGSDLLVPFSEESGHSDLVLALVGAGASFNPKTIGVPLLIRAVEDHNEDLIRALLDKGVNPNDHSFGLTPLRRLSMAGYFVSAWDMYVNAGPPVGNRTAAELLNDAAAKDVALANLFLSKGAEPKLGFNRMALIDAASSGNKALVQVLLEHGSPVNVSDREQLDFLSPSIARGNANKPPFASMEKLAAAIYTGPKAQRDCALRFYVETVEHDWLSTPEKANQPLLSAPFGPYLLRKGLTPLLAAAGIGSTDVARLLLEKEADVKATDHWGRNALILVLAQGRSRIASAVAEARTEQRHLLVQMQDDDAREEAHQRAELGWPQEPQLVSEKEQQFWDTWAAEGDEETVRLLIDWGIDVRAVSPLDGRTALHIGVSRGTLSIIQALLGAGANPNSTDKSGQTPLMLLVKEGRRQQAEIHGQELLTPKLIGGEGTYIPIDGVVLWIADKDLKHLDKKALHAQASALKARMQAERTEAISRDIAIIQALRAAGADPNLKDKSGLSALDWARRLNYPEAASALQAR